MHRTPGFKGEGNRLHGVQYYSMGVSPKVPKAAAELGSDLGLPNPAVPHCCLCLMVGDRGCDPRTVLPLAGHLGQSSLCQVEPKVDKRVIGSLLLVVCVHVEGHITIGDKELETPASTLAAV